MYATKDGYVRTEIEKLVVGERLEATLPLSAVISEAGGGGSGGGSGGGTVAFTIEPQAGGEALSFGTLHPGETQTKTAILRNTGQVRVYVEALVSGDDLFRNYLTLDQKLREGEEFSISMDVPGDNVPIFASCRVAWQRQSDRSSIYETGVKFTQINNFDKGRLLEHIYLQWLRLLDRTH